MQILLEIERLSRISWTINNETQLLWDRPFFSGLTKFWTIIQRTIIQIKTVHILVECIHVLLTACTHTEINKFLHGTLPNLPNVSFDHEQCSVKLIINFYCCILHMACNHVIFLFWKYFLVFFATLHAIYVYVVPVSWAHGLL